MPEENGGVAFTRPESWLVVGLGNPGFRYSGSPHNLGFMVVDRLADLHGIRVKRMECQALVGEGRIEGVQVVLAKPQTFMNLSGASVREILPKKGLKPAEMIVVHDDHDLPWMSLRIRTKGSAGGHHGIQSIIGCIGTSEFTRVRMGIGQTQGGRAEPSFLLSPFRRGQHKELAEFLDYTAQAIAAIISGGVEMAMTRYNRRAPGENTEEE